MARGRPWTGQGRRLHCFGMRQPGCARLDGDGSGRDSMQALRYVVLDGAPATTVDGTRVVLPTGHSEVRHTAEGFVIAVVDAEPITVSAGEFERLLTEGQLHRMAPQ